MIEPPEKFVSRNNCICAIRISFEPLQKKIVCYTPWPVPGMPKLQSWGCLVDGSHKAVALPIYASCTSFLLLCPCGSARCLLLRGSSYRCPCFTGNRSTPHTLVYV